MIDDILRAAVSTKASDVHINVGLPPMFRIHTVMQPSDFPIATPDGSQRLMKEILPEKRWADFEVRRDADFSYEIPGVGRFRVNAHYQRGGIALAFRTINDKVRPIEQLFLPEICNKLTYLPRGLILVTGGTGSGKSTTLAGMIDAMNKREAIHIITMEDPIEYAFLNNKATIRLCQRIAARSATGPGRDSGRRNARSGNDISRDHGR
jgi:twitching motility protein PilT